MESFQLPPFRLRSGFLVPPWEVCNIGCHPRPSQNRTSGFPTSGSSVCLSRPTSRKRAKSPLFALGLLPFVIPPLRWANVCPLAIDSPWGPSLLRYYPFSSLNRSPSQAEAPSAWLLFKVAFAYSSRLRWAVKSSSTRLVCLLLRLVFARCRLRPRGWAS